MVPGAARSLAPIIRISGTASARKRPWRCGRRSWPWCGRAGKSSRCCESDAYRPRRSFGRQVLRGSSLDGAEHLSVFNFYDPRLVLAEPGRNVVLAVTAVQHAHHQLSIMSCQRHDLLPLSNSPLSLAQLAAESSPGCRRWVRKRVLWEVPEQEKPRRSGAGVRRRGCGRIARCHDLSGRRIFQIFQPLI